jgi:TIR domain
LRGGENLKTVKHVGPSYIDVSTIFNSGAGIPESFLRGCGVPEIFIRHLPALFLQPIQFHACFISYSTADRLFARKLHDRLQARGIRCWLDEHQMRQRSVSLKRIERGFHAGDKVLLCCSRASLTSWWIDDEIDSACEKEPRLAQDGCQEVHAIIPLDLDGYLLSDEWRSGRKDEMLSRPAPDFTGWENDDAKFDEQLERLVTSLRTEPGAREAPADPSR